MMESDDGIAAEPRPSASATTGELDLVLMMRLKVLEIDEILGSVTGQMDNYVHLAELYALRGDMDQAASMFEQALRVTNQLGVDESAGQAFLVLGAICLARGDMERGEPLIRRAADIFAGLQNRRPLALTTRLMACVLQHQGSWEEAELVLDDRSPRRRATTLSVRTSALHCRRSGAKSAAGRPTPEGSASLPQQARGRHSRPTFIPIPNPALRVTVRVSGRFESVLIPERLGL
jgi:hypothetical protein